MVGATIMPLPARDDPDRVPADGGRRDAAEGRDVSICAIALWLRNKDLYNRACCRRVRAPSHVHNTSLGSSICDISSKSFSIVLAAPLLIKLSAHVESALNLHMQIINSRLK